MSDGNPNGGRSVTLIIGLVLVAIGLSALVNNTFLPWFGPVRDVVRGAREFVGPAILILIGAAILYFSQAGGTLRMPEKGKRLYRSRDKKMIAGVVGGLSDYLGIDVTVLRLVVVALALLNFGGTLVAYIVGAVIIPLEPTEGPPQPPASGRTTPPPPAPPRIPRG